MSSSPSAPRKATPLRWSRSHDSATEGFFSYAHADEAHRKTLAKHLSALEDEGLIAVWHDRKITGGREWAGAIDDALRSADIVLLLISADFLASDYCNDVELTEAIRRHDAAQARVVPVILRSCDWEHSRFARFNALPPDGVPVVEAEHPDQRFVAVARGLRAIVAELTSLDSATTTQNPTRSDASPATSPAPGAEAPSADAGARHAPSAGDAAAPAPKPRRLTIGKISLFGIELGGPFEIPLPQLGAKPLLLGLGILVLLTACLEEACISSPSAAHSPRRAMPCAWRAMTQRLTHSTPFPPGFATGPRGPPCGRRRAWVPGLTNLRRIGSPSARTCAGNAPTGRPMLT